MKTERVSTGCWVIPPRLGTLHIILPGKSLQVTCFLLPLSSPTPTSLSSSLSPPSLPIGPCAPRMLGVSAAPPHSLQPSRCLFSLSLQGQFCWTSLWNGIKTNRCPRTLCIAARESLLPRFRHPSAINCCLYEAHAAFLAPSASRGSVLVFAIEWALLAV